MVQFFTARNRALSQDVNRSFAEDNVSSQEDRPWGRREEVTTMTPDDRGPELEGMEIFCFRPGDVGVQKGEYCRNVTFAKASYRPRTDSNLLIGTPCCFPLLRGYVCNFVGLAMY
jgi:hypothetical protein